MAEYRLRWLVTALALVGAACSEAGDTGGAAGPGGAGGSVGGNTGGFAGNGASAGNAGTSGVGGVAGSAGAGASGGTGVGGVGAMGGVAGTAGAGANGGSSGGAGGGGMGGDGGSGGVPQGVFGVPNHDDDNDNGTRDWDDPPFDSDNERLVWSVPDEFKNLAAGETLELTLAGALDQIRFYAASEVVLGATPSGEKSTLTLDAASAGMEFRTEFADFLSRGTLTLRRLDAAAGELAKAELVVIAAPLIINHHLQASEHVWVVAASTNTSMVNEYKAVLGDRLTVISSSDVWIQDELEWATATAPGARLDIAIDSIRDRELDQYVKGLKAPDIQPMTWGQAGQGRSEDKFGNLEVTPPHTAGGVSYPFGRIYYGDKGVEAPNAEIKAFLDAQKIQKPIKADTSWLCVGHVDEFLSFLPDSSAPKGFKFMITDTIAAYAVLEKMDRALELPRYADSHGYATVGAILDDTALKTLNDELQRDYLDPMRELFKSELELSDAEVLKIPGIFEDVGSCPYSDAPLEVAALIPGMLNLIVTNFVGEAPHIFVSDPFMRSDVNSQSGDPFIQAFADALPAGYTVHHVDDWYTYHVNTGEVHCGTNVTRTPAADWWTVGLDLLGVP